MDELLRIKAFIADDNKAIDTENHSILFTIPEIVDRDDEIVTADAIYNALQDKKSFAANPICLPCHQHRLEGGEPPCVGSWDIESAKKLTNAVNISLKFATGTKLGDAYWNCYSNKHMRAISIGFRTKDFSMEERNRIQVKIISKIELFEISCVAVGCNPGALSKLKAQFGWDDKGGNKELEEMIKQIVISEADKKFIKDFADLRAEIEDLKLLVMPDNGFAETLLLDDDSDLSDSAGKDKYEQTLSRILNCLEKVKEK